eukprot:m.65082 g.65082  ORF g.65082 m.65082 type:complete len:414 (-) comp12045_c0_seq1:382-1623(-)
MARENQTLLWEVGHVVKAVIWLSLFSGSIVAYMVPLIHLEQYPWFSELLRLGITVAVCFVPSRVVFYKMRPAQYDVALPWLVYLCSGAYAALLLIGERTGFSKQQTPTPTPTKSWTVLPTSMILWEATVHLGLYVLMCACLVSSRPARHRSVYAFWIGSAWAIGVVDVLRLAIDSNLANCWTCGQASKANELTSMYLTIMNNRHISLSLFRVVALGVATWLWSRLCATHPYHANDNYVTCNDHNRSQRSHGVWSTISRFVSKHAQGSLMSTVLGFSCVALLLARLGHHASNAPAICHPSTVQAPQIGSGNIDVLPCLSNSAWLVLDSVAIVVILPFLALRLTYTLSGIPWTTVTTLCDASWLVCGALLATQTPTLLYTLQPPYATYTTIAWGTTPTIVATLFVVTTARYTERL